MQRVHQTFFPCSDTPPKLGDTLPLNKRSVLMFQKESHQRSNIKLRCLHSKHLWLKHQMLTTARHLLMLFHHSKFREVAKSQVVLSTKRI